MPAEHDVPAYMLFPWGCRLLHEASQLGFPLLVKAVSGGGGKGMKLAMNMKVSVTCLLWPHCGGQLTQGRFLYLIAAYRAVAGSIYTYTLPLPNLHQPSWQSDLNHSHHAGGARGACICPA
jgi:hypothetical protein